MKYEARIKNYGGNHESRIMNQGKLKSFTDLNAWKEAHKLVLDIYKITQKFPEVQNQLLIARDIKYITREEFSLSAEQTIIVSKLLNGLIKKSKTIIHDS